MCVSGTGQRSDTSHIAHVKRLTQPAQCIFYWVGISIGRLSRYHNRGVLNEHHPKCRTGFGCLHDDVLVVVSNVSLKDIKSVFMSSQSRRRGVKLNVGNNITQ